MTDKNILDLYRHDVDAPRDVHYMHYYPGGRRTLSTVDFFSRTAALAEALAKLGVEKGSRVMILSDNRPEWHIVDLACLDLGALDVPVYTTLTPQQIAYQAKDSGAMVAVVENAELMDRFLQIRDECSELEHLVQIEGDMEKGVVSLDELIARGESGDAGKNFWDRAEKIDSGQLATLIYTSGTTGEPKGVMLTHENFVENVKHAVQRIPVDPDELVMEFLPLSHVLERCVGYSFFYRAVTRAYVSPHHVADLVSEVAPYFFASVPRLFEKIHDKIQGKVASSPPAKQKLFRWALAQGREVSNLKLQGREPGTMQGMKYSIADKLVLSKVRAALGGRLRGTLSGGAPLPLHVNEFFYSLGIPIWEGYGLTETSPAITLSGVKPGMTKLGSVGKVLENLEIRIADDGELLVKGPSVMKGYWNKPDQTEEVFTEEGFFCTGDVARIDNDGFVFITDRKKDLIVNAGGKNIAPQMIENQIKESRFVDNVVIIGDRRPFCVALVSPNIEELEPWARAEGIAFADPSELPEHPKVAKLFEKVIRGVNERLAPFEQVKKFRVLPLTLTIESGHLTPTMKVKRKVIENEYTDLIEQMYAEGRSNDERSLA